MSNTQSEIRTLDQIPMGESVVVVDVVEVVNAASVSAGEQTGDADPIARRLGDLGMRRGARVEVIRRAPLGDPTVFELCDYQLCLRQTESARVRVRRLPDQAAERDRA